MAVNRVNIDLGIILKRSSSVNAINESNTVIDIRKNLDLLSSQLKSINEDGHRPSPSLKNTLCSFINGISIYENANRYYIDALYILQEFNSINKNDAKYILNEYCSRVLPYVSDLSTIEESVSRYNLSVEQSKTILEYANKYQIADRILLNHEKISKRFNIVKEINKINYKGLRDIVEYCCSMIDTYSIPCYAKYNLCLEEMGYVFEKEGIEYNKKEFVKYVTEYFLLRSDAISSKELKGYRLVLNENSFINEDDTEYVKYLRDDNYSLDNTSIKKSIERFYISQEKTPAELEDVVICCMNSSITDITHNTINILWLIWNVYKNDIFESEMVDIDKLFNIIIRRLEEDDITRNDINDVLNQFNSISNLLIVTASDSYEYSMKIVNFKKCLDLAIEKLDNLSFVNYSEINIKNMNFVNSYDAEPMALKEFKIFKFHNLTKAAINLDKYLKYKAKNIYDKSKDKSRKAIKKINDVLFSENADMFSFIGEDCRADICIAQYLIEDNINDIYNFLEEVCNEYNSQLKCNNFDTVRCYYTMTSYTAELHLKEATKIALEESEYEKIRETYDPSLDIYVNQFAVSEACNDILEEYSEVELNLTNRLATFVENKNLTLEHYTLALEALSLMNASKDDIYLFKDNFSKYRYNSALLESVITEDQYNKEINIIERAAKNWEPINSSLDIQVEAFQILNAILEDAPNIKKPKVGPDAIKKSSKEEKPKDNPNTKVDESRKNPFKGINVNNIALYLQGLKTKAKEMSAKEKELSRNLDNDMRRFVKGMKDALISDRREAIIKGSVIPSFSRCIKIAIGLAGIGAIAGNPVVPILIAMGGFAASKKLTQKERILLLDEIEVELDVLEKEIAMAESKNQMKKYRALLKYKKDLQRQYQRIRYNIRVGKDILPGSAVGVGSGKD